MSDDGVERIAHVDANGKLAQKEALALRTSLVHKMLPRSMNADASAGLAARFLVGMQSPPPRA